jgi:RimJ/RimL family protein N-acetyltransferase
MTPEGRTDRLLLRPLELADAAQIQQIFPHWEVVRYLLNIVPWPYPPDGARQYIENIAQPAIERGAEFHWTLRLRAEPDRLIGAIGLKIHEDDHRGFWLGLPWHGQGLMCEAAAWTNDFWFDGLGFPLLRVSKAADNLASRRISEKQGMRLVGMHEKDYVAGRLPSEIWELTASEWRAWKATQVD